MKKILSITAMVLFALAICAQEKEVTKFLGIPVDGYKAEMRKKLIAKGFTPKTIDGNELFEGEFNGYDVNVYIITNNNKVYRIMLCDKNTQDAANIKIRFNSLCRQFENNKRYYTPKDFTIPEDEDISFEMTVHDKIYEAGFFQLPDNLSLTDEETEKSAIETLNRSVWFRITKFYGKYFITMYYDNKYNEANGEDL